MVLEHFKIFDKILVAFVYSSLCVCARVIAREIVCILHYSKWNDSGFVAG